MKQLHLLLLSVGWLLLPELQAQTPIAAYDFSGNAKDKSTFVNHASVNGATLTQDRFGLPNRAFLFNGTQSSLLANNTAQLNSAAATISFWVRPTAFPAQGEVYLLSCGGYQERWKISMPNHGKPVFTTHAGGACCSDMDSGTPLALGTWTHVAMTHDGAKDIIYFNGVKVNEKNVAGALDPTVKPLGIGYDPIENTNFFNGALDDVQLFNTALTAVQIAALYAAQNMPPNTAQSKVADYTFSGDGTDNTDFENHADLLTAALTTDRFGFGNRALLLNGSSTAVRASNGAHLNSGTATISFWIKPAAFPAQGEVYLLSFGGYQERFKISMPGHGKPVFTTHAGGACCSDMDSGTPLVLNTWTHVTMIHNGTKDIIYFNGLKVNEKNVAGNLDPSTKPLGIGYDPIDNNNWFNGALDEIALYNYALTDVAVMALYTAQAAFPGTSNELVAVYSLNGNGADAAQFGNHAQLGTTTTAAVSRHGWANNAIKGTATATNSAALQSAYTTISFWAKPNTLPATGEVYLLSHGGYQERWKISMPNHGKPVFTTHAGGACCSDMDSGTPLVVGTWAHVVMVHDGTKDLIYFNGVKVNEKNVAGALDKTKYPLGIGYDPIENSNPFDGNLDDVQIYNRALSAAEIAALYTAQNQAPAVPGNLVAHYTFGGNSADATAYRNDATGSTLTKDRFGKANQAAAFNGTTTKVTAANSPQHNSANTTISFWIKPTALPASGEMYLLSSGGYQERWKISMPAHGKPVFTTHAGGACCSDMDSGTPLVVGTWTHVVMTHDGVKDIIYLNGVKANEKNVTGALDPTTKPLGIGFDPIENNNFFNGALDEVQIYKTALTATEVAALYAAQNQAPANTDTEAPCAPLNLVAGVNFTNVLLSWLPAMDNVGIAAYNVYQDGALVATTTSAKAAISGLKPLTAFVFGVSAVDAAGNESLITTLKVTSGQDQTPDTTPPTIPGNLAGTAAANSVLVSWSASTDNVQVAGYVILVDGVPFDTVSASTLSIFISGLNPSTLYTFEVYAFDLAKNKSASAEITLRTTQPINTGEPGMVAHYRFDGDAKDATPYLNHGVIGGNPVFEVANHPNSGGGQNIKFDGMQDSVLVPNAVQLISDYATVSFWIRVDDTNLQVAEAYILDFGHWSQRWKISLPNHLRIVWTTNSNNVQFPNFISDMDSGDGNEMVKGFWWYVTMVHDGTNDIIYVNGQQTKIKPVLGKLNSTARPLCFGSNPIEGGQYFIGALDNVKIYNKALTAAEILKLYNTGTTGLDDQTDALRGLVLRISPNPVSDLLTVQHAFTGSEPLLVRVFDVQGRQVDQLSFAKHEVPNGQFSFPTGAYPTGSYTLNFVLGGRNLGAVVFVKKGL
jgi:chitodextrinase